MGYFDALTSSSFKITEDGRRLFCPWGTLGRAYAIPSEREFERLHRCVKAHRVVSLRYDRKLWIVEPVTLAAYPPV